MKTVNIKDALIVGSILVILYCLFKGPVLERLEGDDKEEGP